MFRLFTGTRNDFQGHMHSVLRSQRHLAFDPRRRYGGVAMVAGKWFPTGL